MTYVRGMVTVRCLLFHLRLHLGFYLGLRLGREMSFELSRHSKPPLKTRHLKSGGMLDAVPILLVHPGIKDLFDIILFS